MDVNSIIILILIPLGAYIMKSLILERLNKLEDKMASTISETEVRDILNDNIEPIRSDIAEIKDDLKHLLNLYLQNKKHG